MKKYQNHNQSIKKVRAAVLAVQGLAFLAYVAWAVVVIVSGFSDFPQYDVIARWFLAVNCLVLLAAIPFYASRLTSKLFNSVAWTLTLAVGFGSTPYVVGGIKDSLGYICTSYFGVQVSCVNDLHFFTSIILFNPLVFFMLSVFTTLVTLVGILDAKRESDRS